jgi:hypothetical protein
MAQDYLRKLRLVLSIKRKVLRCAASKTTRLRGAACLVAKWVVTPKRRHDSKRGAEVTKPAPTPIGHVISREVFR